MEESEKRRERLRAMRMEAGVSNTSCSCSSSSSSPSSLSNPLLERPLEDSHAAAPRFGFYTDPMAAFSSDKRRTGLPHSTPRPHFSPSPSVTGQQNPEMPVSGVHQFQNNYSPYQNMHQGGDPYYSPGPPISPMGIRSPYPMHQGSPSFSSAPGRGHWFNNSPSPGPGHGGSPYPVHQGSPNFRSPPPGRGRWYNNSPSSGPGLGHGGGPSPSIGRGRGRWDGSGMSPGSRHSRGRGGGGGRGSNFDGQTRSFYQKSMVEDPWESLTPVIWKGENAAWRNFNNQGLLQKTPIAKKPRVSDPFNTSNSKQSLAEFLAASFDEAAGDAATM